MFYPQGAYRLVYVIEHEHEKYKWEMLDAIKELQICAIEAQ